MLVGRDAAADYAREMEAIEASGEALRDLLARHPWIPLSEQVFINAEISRRKCEAQEKWQKAKMRVEIQECKRRFLPCPYKRR